MKKLNFEQMESIRGSGFKWACLGQVADGIGVLGSFAFVLTVSNPIGWGLLAISAIGLVAANIADPTACD